MAKSGVRVYSTRQYQRDRKALLAGSPSCSYCPTPATEADHVPPLSRHFHRQGSGCCILVPSCFHHGRVQGGHLATGRAGPTPKPALPVAEDPPGFDVDSSVWDVAWLAELRTVPPDGWWPRLMTVPHPNAVGSYGAEVVEWAKTHRGITLYWWQQLVLTRMLEHDVHERLVWRDVFLSVARQSGKSTLVSILGDWRSEQGDRFGEPQLVMHTADTLRHAIDVWQLAVTRAEMNGCKVRRGAGMQAIEKLDGGSWVIRSQAAVVGSSASMAIADEAQGVKLATITENLSPTLVERQQAQMLLVSTSHSACTDLMPTYRLGATAELDSPGRTLMLEWSAAPDLELGDPIAARQASPHWSANRELDIGEAVARAMGTPPGHELRVAVDAQWYNRWPSLASRGAGESLLEVGVWAGCHGSIVATQPGWVAVEDYWGRGAAVAFAAGDGERFEVDGVVCGTWAEAMVWARKFLEASPFSRLLVGASMMRSVPADMPGRMQRAGGIETRRGLAVLRSLVADGRVVHDRTPDLDAQIVGARVRPVVDGIQLVSEGRQDLLKAALWALYFAHRPPTAPTIH
jgi:hypothetical protein